MLVNRFDYNHAFNGDYYGVGAQIMETGRYDPLDVENLKGLLQLRRQYFGDGVVALDLGANIGVHTLEWARLMKGWGGVMAVEAQERIFYALAGNITLQNAGNAKAIWAAIDEAPGELSFPEPDYTKNGSYGSFELKPRLGTEFIGQPVDYDKPTCTVQTMTIDSWKLPRCDLIKMDLEGMEEAGLRGAAETIQRCKPILFIETVKSDKDAITATLEGYGYKVLPSGMNVMAIHKTDKSLGHVAVEREQR